ncbi:hypothetical protein BH24GEM3_BH24GEM3_26360 [soil metagenome]
MMPLDVLPAAGTVAGEGVRALAVGALFLLVFSAAELWQRRGEPPVEWTRKLVHFGGGMISASLPWVFASHWTVLALGVLFAGIIWGTRRLGLLCSVHGVERSSQGGIYFPIAVYLLFLLSAHQPVFYLISLLVLVVADTVAAVLGSAYGRRMYAVESDRRSLEGSAVFFLTSFLCVHLPLLLLTEIEPAASVVIALQLALLVTFFEAISLRGSDNLIVPLVTYYLLVKMTPKSAEFIGLQLLAQLAIIGVVALVVWRYRFVSLSGAVVITLVLYGAFSLGGPAWLVAPALALAGFTALYRALCRTDSQPDTRYQVIALFYVSLIGAALFVVNNAFAMLVPDSFRLPVADPLYAPFVGVVAAQLALMFFTLLEPLGTRRRLARLGGAPAAAAVGFLLVAPVGLWVGVEGITLWGLAIAASISFGGLLLFRAGRWLVGWPRQAPWSVRLQAASVGMATLAVLPLHLWWIGGFW